MKRLIFGTILVFAICPAIFGQTAANNCPKIMILGPPGVTRPGDEMTFDASVNNLSGPGEIKYEWTVSAGTIENGQGTPGIEVRTTRAMNDSNVTATVKVIGIPAGCPDSASETGSVSGGHATTLIDEFGNLARDDIKARIDNFYIYLKHNGPNAEGTIFVRLDKEAARNSKLLYLNNLYHAIISRKYDPARVTFIMSEERGEFLPSTRLWILPPGFDFPDGGENPILIKGEDFKQKINGIFKPNK